LINDANVNSQVNEANLILVQTNNATFADSGQSMQQLNISRVRAIEFNKWVVSVSTTGVSAIIDNQGAIRSITEQNSADYINANVALIQGDSYAQRFNGYNSLLIPAFAIGLYLRKKKYHE
jgi:apolipoprotein N-acyltransferase